MDMVSRMVNEKPLVIFSKSSCCICYTVKTLICSFGANPTVYDLDQIPNGQQVEGALQQLGCQPSVPAVFIGQQLVGGASKIISLNLQNELGPMLVRAGAIWLWKKK